MENDNYTNETYEYGLEAVKQNQNNIVLFGQIGAGKTTLMNFLCESNYKTASFGYSCTRSVKICPSTINNMMVIDFPGLNSQNDIIKHLSQQKNVLKIIPVRLICMVIKYDSRYDLIMKQCNQILKIFKHHINNLVIVITHTEGVNLTIKSELEHIFLSKFKLSKIIFSNMNIGPGYLSNKLSNFRDKVLNIEETVIESLELFKQVDGECDYQFEEIHEKYINDFNEILELHKEVFNETDERELKRALYFSLREYKDDISRDFRKEFEKEGLEVDEVVTQVLCFQNAIYHKYKGFKTLAEKCLDIQSVNYSSALNRYKTCPFCGVIWFRVYGCDSITCGNRSISKDNFFGKFAKFIIKIEGKGQKSRKKLQVTKKDFENFGTFKDTGVIGLTKDEVTLNLSKKVKIQPQGCGKKMRWEEMEDVTETALQKLKTIEMTDYFNQIEEFSKFEITKSKI